MLNHLEYFKFVRFKKDTTYNLLPINMFIVYINTQYANFMVESLKFRDFYLGFVVKVSNAFNKYTCGGYFSSKIYVL